MGWNVLKDELRDGRRQRCFVFVTSHLSRFWEVVSKHASLASIKLFSQTCPAAQPLESSKLDVSMEHESWELLCFKMFSGQMSLGDCSSLLYSRRCPGTACLSQALPCQCAGLDFQRPHLQLCLKSCCWCLGNNSKR